MSGEHHDDLKYLGVPGPVIADLGRIVVVSGRLELAAADLATALALNTVGESFSRTLKMIRLALTAGLPAYARTIAVEVDGWCERAFTAMDERDKALHAAIVQMAADGEWAPIHWHVRSGDKRVVGDGFFEPVIAALTATWTECLKLEHSLTPEIRPGVLYRLWSRNGGDDYRVVNHPVAGRQPDRLTDEELMALVLVPLVRDHGVEYLLAATVLAGAIQIALGALGIGRLMRFIPRTVMTGFVNALAILIFLAQVPHITGGPAALALLGVGLAIIVVLPRVTKVVPAPLVAIVAVAGAAAFLHLDVPTVGEMGELPSALPMLGIPSVPFTLGTLGILLPVSITLAFVGLLESLLTAQLLDDITDTRSDKDVEARGQGLANIVTGFLGGMAGCAMIGQSMINVKSGGRTRLSTLSQPACSCSA